MHKLYHLFKQPRPRLRVWPALGFILLLGWSSPAQTSVVVTNASLAALQSAMAGGGTITLSFSGTIAITAPLRIVVDTTLDAGTNSVTLTGGGASGIFEVASNINFALKNLTLSGGTNLGAGGLAGTTGASGPNLGSNGGNGGNGSNALGGAIYNQGFSSAINCVFLDNSATGGAGGAGGGGGSGSFQAGNGGNGGNGGYGYGGAIYNLGTLLLSNCAFSGNTAFGGSGGAGGTNGAGGFSFAGAGGVGAAAAGAGLYNLGAATIVNCTFSANFSQGGTSQTASGAANNGNGANGQSGASAQGGAICNLGTNTIVNSTFFLNLAGGGNGGSGGNASGRGFLGGNGGNGGNAYGGSLYNGGAGSVSLVNCTFAGGVVDGGTNGAAGGGSFPGGAGSVGAGHGANVANHGGVFTLQNTLLAYPTNGANAYGVFKDLDNNISTDGSPAFGQTNSFNNLDPVLEPLATNGGPTMTMALALGSPAINAIYDSSSPAFDQRGAPRPFGPRSDIGAYEFGAVVPLILTTNQAMASILVKTNSVRLSFSGVANLGYRIQASTDLVNWLNLATNNSGANGGFSYTDGATNSHRFYRALTP